MTDHNNRPEQPQEAGEKLEAQEVFEQATAPITPLAQENQQALTAEEENPLRGMSVREWLEWQDREPEAANAAMQDIIRPLAGLTPETLGGISGAIEGLKPLDLGITKGLQAANLATGFKNPFAEIQESLRPLREWQESIKPLTEGIAGLTVETEAMRTWRDSVQSIYKGIYDTIESIQGKMDWKKINAAQEALASMGRTIIETTEKINQAVSEPLQRLAQWADDVKEANEARAAAFNAGDYKTAFDGFADDIDDYLPYLIKAIEAYKTENGIEEITWYDFFQFRADTAGEPAEEDIEIAPEDEPQGIFYICMKRAIESKQLAEAAAKIAEQATLLQSAPPKKHTMPNNRLSWALGEGLINAGEQNLPVLPEDKKKHLQQTTAYVMATYQDGAGVQIDGNYSMYDRSVNNAITSLFLHGHDSHIFTSEMVYRAMTNGTDSAAPSPQQTAAVTRSIERQRRTHVTVDATEEMERRNILDDNGKPFRFKVGKFLLVLTDIEVSAGGKTKHGYYIQEEPLLYTYSNLTGQVLTVKSSVLDVRELTKLPSGQKAAGASIPNTEGRIAIKEYLIMRIEVVKNDFKRAKEEHKKYQTRRKKDSTLEDKPITAFCKQQHRILFETIFSMAGIVTNSRQAESNYRDYIFSALDYWQFTGYIEGYSIVKGDKGKMRGFDLKLK